MLLRCFGLRAATVDLPASLLALLASRSAAAAAAAAARSNADSVGPPGVSLRGRAVLGGLSSQVGGDPALSGGDNSRDAAQLSGASTLTATVAVAAAAQPGQKAPVVADFEAAVERATRGGGSYNGDDSTFVVVIDCVILHDLLLRVRSRGALHSRSLRSILYARLIRLASSHYPPGIPRPASALALCDRRQLSAARPPQRPCSRLRLGGAASDRRQLWLTGLTCCARKISRDSSKLALRRPFRSHCKSGVNH